MRRCLEGIDFRWNAAGDGLYRVTAPACRHDVSREVDLIEELARVSGYERIPVPPRMSVTPAVGGRRAWQRAGGGEETLAGLGLREVYDHEFHRDGPGGNHIRRWRL